MASGFGSKKQPRANTTLPNPLRPSAFALGSPDLCQLILSFSNPCAVGRLALTDRCWREQATHMVLRAARRSSEPLLCTRNVWALLRSMTVLRVTEAGLLVLGYEDPTLESQLLAFQKRSALLYAAGMPGEAEKYMEREKAKIVEDCIAGQEYGGTIDGVYQLFSVSDRYVVYRIYRPTPCYGGHSWFFCFRPRKSVTELCDPDHWYIASINELAFLHTRRQLHQMGVDQNLRQRITDALLDCHELVVKDPSVQALYHQPECPLLKWLVDSYIPHQSLQLIFSANCRSPDELMPPQTGWGWCDHMSEVTKLRGEICSLGLQPKLEYLFSQQEIWTLKDENALSSEPVIVCDRIGEAPEGELQTCCLGHQLLSGECVFCKPGVSTLRYTKGWQNLARPDIYGDGALQVWLPCRRCGNASYHVVY